MRLVQLDTSGWTGWRSARAWLWAGCGQCAAPHPWSRML